MTGVRFLAVGGFCAALHNAILIMGDIIGVHYILSSIVSFAVVVVAGYLLHHRFTFRTSVQNPSFARYVLGMAANFPLSLLALFVLIDVLGMPVWAAAPLSTCVLVLWNYAATRWALVRNPA